MFRFVLLLLALLLAVLGSLTAVKSPDWAPWKLALLAGEYGHWVALAPIVVAAVAWLSRENTVLLPGATVLVCAVALGLFLKPATEAALLAGELPARLEKQFGRVELARPPFALSALVCGGEKPVPVETMKFSGELALDFYHASAKAAAGKPTASRVGVPCIVLVHGGGWDAGDRSEIAHFNHWLAHRGYAVAAIDYRLAPKFTWPAPRDDVLAAMAFLKSHAATLGIDPTRLVLFGRSAGGNIAEATAYTADDPAIRGLVALYSPADLHFGYLYGREDDVVKSPLLLRQYLGGPPETARANYDAASGYLHVGKNSPPTLLVHGVLDPLTWYRQSERLDARLTENGVPHVFVSLPWATHAFEYNPSGPSGQLTTFALEWFLAAVTK